MADTQRTSTWRAKYKVHPVADVFPMMSDEELAALGADIKANGLQVRSASSSRSDSCSTIECEGQWHFGDGRNRLEAMERVGIELTPCAIEIVNINDVDPVASIIGRNIHRRHLTRSSNST